MPFPQLAATSSGNLASNTLTASLSIMSGVNSGDFLFAVVATDGAPVITWDQSAAGTWTENNTRANATNNKITSWWKIADGTESDKQLKVYFDAVEQYAYHVSRWTGVYTAGNVPESAPTITTTVSCTVPPITVTTGSLSYAYVALISYDNGTVAISTYPTSYINTSNVRANSTTGVGLGFASTTSAGTSQAARQYVLNAAEQAVTVHVSIRPAAVAGPDQTATLTLIASGLTHYTPTMYRRLQFALPAPSSGLVFYTPTMLAGDVTATLTAVASGLTIYTPTIQGVAAQTITANLVASGLTFYTPTITVGDVTATLGLVASGLTFYTPTINPGDVTATLGLVASGLTHYTPTFGLRLQFPLGLVASGLTHYSPAFGMRLSFVLPFKDSGVSIFTPTMYAPPIVTVKLRAVTLDLLEMGTVQVINANY